MILRTIVFCILLSACTAKVVKNEVILEKTANDENFLNEKQPDEYLIDDACNLLHSRPHWRIALQEVQREWQIPPWYILAIMHQESRFNPYALSKSMAYGFPQAKDDTWSWYQLKRFRKNASRERFDDAADFIAWYAAQNKLRNKVELHDIRNQYLAYHEGLGGFERKSFLAKSWLLEIAEKVKDRAVYYHTQLLTCDE